MNKTKTRKTTLITLITIFVLVFALALGTLTPFKSASAATQYTPSEIFSSGTGGSVTASEEDDEGNAYAQFTFSSENGAVYFRRDLALKWYSATPTADEEEDGTEEGGTEDEPSTASDEPTTADEPTASTETTLANPGVCNYYSMEFAFDEINFTTFTLTYESVEENVSKDETSSNSIVFKNDNGTVTIGVKDASLTDDDNWEESVTFTEVDISSGVTLTIDETDCEIGKESGTGTEEVDIGEFSVYINGVCVGKLTNIGAYYLEYLSSASDTPRDPIEFTVEGFEDGAESTIIYMKDINGQSFLLDEDSKITDNAAPVLVVSEKVYSYKLGQKWSLDYAAVDVCDTSVSVNRYYYMVETNDDGNYVEGDYSSLSTSTFLMPADDQGDVEQYVSIRFQLTDDNGVTDDNGDSYIYLTWYAADNAVKTLNIINDDEEDDTFDYIIVDRSEVGPVYLGLAAGYFYYKDDAGNYVDENGNASEDPVVIVDSEGAAITDEEEAKTIAEAANLSCVFVKGNYQSADMQEKIDEYQEAVYEAAEGLSAGDGAYFYLPSLRALIGSDYADYRNLTFSVYYYTQSQSTGSSASSQTSLDYNELKFEISEMGIYIFCVIAVDSSSNAMYYYDEGKLVELSSSNIWDIDEIPKFTFEVSYTGAVIEDAGEQSLGYRDSTYDISSFDIVAISGYETEYKLYYVDETAMAEDNYSVPFSSYSDFVENATAYVEQLKEAGYLIEISEYNSDIDEDDDAWDRTDNDYYWYPDSLTFMPVETGYYVVELIVTESVLPGNTAYGYQVIDVRNPLDTPPDVSTWLQNNVASVVLFSISAVLAIVIVILFVVKPSEETLDEVDLQKLKKAGKKKKSIEKAHAKYGKKDKKTEDLQETEQDPDEGDKE